MDERARMKKAVLIICLLAVVGAASLWIFQRGKSDQPLTLATAQIDLGEGGLLYAENCAACHGANLEGQPNWQSPAADGRLPPPPHDATGHTWHHDDQLLFDYTKLGGTALMAAKGLDFDSGMPQFEGTLTDAEIWNIIAYIQSTWPERIREVQASRTESEQLRGN